MAKDARNTVALSTTNAPAPSANASGGPPTNQADVQAAPAGTTAQASSALPAAMRGRWGLTPMDCTSTNGDAKGRLEIGPNELRFYESRAVPTSDVHFEPTSAAGTFNFTGEGQTWTKYEALKLQRDLLIRTESNPTASFTYAKCS
ncbi:hypothetical protein [Sphingomonas sp. F9_3S_D5_B_2]